MASAVGWFVPGRVVVMKMSGYCLLPHMEVAARQAAQLIRYGSPPVYLIMDLREMEHRLPSIKEIRDYNTVFKERNLAWTFALTDDQMLYFIFSASAQKEDAAFQVRRTPQEVMAFLRRADKTLPEFENYDTFVRDELSVSA